MGGSFVVDLLSTASGTRWGNGTSRAVNITPVPLSCACQWPIASPTKLVMGVNRSSGQAGTTRCALTAPCLSLWRACPTDVRLC